MGQFYGRYLGKIALNQQGVDWAARDLSYLIKPEYDRRFSQWIADATEVHSLESALRRTSEGSGVALRLNYSHEKELVAMCKRLGLMEDLKALTLTLILTLTLTLTLTQAARADEGPQGARTTTLTRTLTLLTLGRVEDLKRNAHRTDAA